MQMKVDVTLSDVMLLGDGSKVTVGTPLLLTRRLKLGWSARPAGQKLSYFAVSAGKITAARRSQQDLTLLNPDINASGKKADASQKGCRQVRSKTSS